MNLPTVDDLPFVQLRPAPTDATIALWNDIAYLRDLLAAAVTQLAVVEKAVRRG